MYGALTGGRDWAVLRASAGAGSGQRTRLLARQVEELQRSRTAAAGAAAGAAEQIQFFGARWRSSLRGRPKPGGTCRGGREGAGFGGTAG